MSAALPSQPWPHDPGSVDPVVGGSRGILSSGWTKAHGRGGGPGGRCASGRSGCDGDVLWPSAPRAAGLARVLRDVASTRYGLMSVLRSAGGERCLFLAAARAADVGTPGTGHNETLMVRGAERRTQWELGRRALHMKRCWLVLE